MERFSRGCSHEYSDLQGAVGFDLSDGQLIDTIEVVKAASPIRVGSRNAAFRNYILYKVNDGGNQRAPALTTCEARELRRKAIRGQP